MTVFLCWPVIKYLINSTQIFREIIKDLESRCTRCSPPAGWCSSCSRTWRLSGSVGHRYRHALQHERLSQPASERKSMVMLKNFIFVNCLPLWCRNAWTDRTSATGSPRGTSQRKERLPGLKVSRRPSCFHIGKLCETIKSNSLRIWSWTNLPVEKSLLHWTSPGFH